MSNEIIEGQVLRSESVSADLMLLKMENETIMSAARMVPRDPMKIVGQLQALIDAYPAAADEAIYSKPVGTVQQVTCGKCGVKYEVVKVDADTACPACDSRERKGVSNVKKFAEGLSIRAAENIRSIYGYTRLATTTEQLDDGKVKLTGTLVDYAAGNMTSDERIVTPFYKSRNGGMQRTPEDRFLNVVVKAEKAKLRRDIILDNTPSIVKAMFRDACEQKLLALVAPEVIEQKIVPAFAEFGISPAHLDKIIGRPHSLGWKEEDRLQCRKILNALKSGETTARELLAEHEETTTSSGKANETVAALKERLADTVAQAAAKHEQTPLDPAADMRAGWLLKLLACKTVDEVNICQRDALENDGVDILTEARDKIQAMNVKASGKPKQRPLPGEA